MIFLPLFLVLNYSEDLGQDMTTKGSGNKLQRQVGGGPVGVVSVASGDRPIRRMTLDHCEGNRHLTPLVWLPLVPEDCLLGGTGISGRWVPRSLLLLGSCLVSFIVIIQFKDGLIHMQKKFSHTLRDLTFFFIFLIELDLL